MTLALRPYQRAAVEALYDYFSASAGNPLVVMPTGTGKSLCIAGFTREAARALGRHERIGRLATGMDCDLAIWDIDAPADLVYRMGFNPLHVRVFRGQQTA